MARRRYLSVLVWAFGLGWLLILAKVRYVDGVPIDWVRVGAMPVGLILLGFVLGYSAGLGSDR